MVCFFVMAVPEVEEKYHQLNTKCIQQGKILNYVIPLHLQIKPPAYQFILDFSDINEIRMWMCDNLEIFPTTAKNKHYN